MAKHSIIITAQDEALHLEATVALVLASEPAPHEVIIIDDGSTIPISLRMGSFPQVKVVRTPPVGVGHARTTGLSIATGDTAILLDGHMRVDCDWLDRIEKAIDKHPNAVISPASDSFGHRNHVRSAGADFTCDGGPGVLFGLRWRKCDPQKSSEIVPAMLGACYAARMEVWNGLGGPNRCLKGLGMSEYDLSLRAWLTGHEVVAVHDMATQHYYSRPKAGNTKVRDFHQSANMLFVIHALFGKEYADMALPFIVHLRGHYGRDEWQRRMTEAYTERARFQSLQRRSIEELEEMGIYTLPTEDMLKEATKRDKERRNGDKVANREQRAHGNQPRPAAPAARNRNQHQNGKARESGFSVVQR